MRVRYSKPFVAKCPQQGLNRQRKQLLLLLLALPAAILTRLFLVAFTSAGIQHDHNLPVLSSSSTIIRKPRRWVALFGPHDRYNFGDLLFEKVVSRLLIERAGYLPEELLSVGMIATNMSRYGGNPNVVSAKKAVEMSHNAVLTGNGPFDIVFLGGEAIGCSFNCGKGMFPSDEQRKQAASQQVSNCAYLMPKDKLVPANLSTQLTAKPVAIANSPGMYGSKRKNGPCISALDAADFIAFRDLKPGTKHPVYPNAQSRPDCAVMVKELFHDLITRRAESGQVQEVVQRTTPQKYIAVQIKRSRKHDQAALAQMLDEIWYHTNFTTVFFMAGSSPGHDTMGVYSSIAKKMKGPSILFYEENVWSIVALISRAAAVLSTSLHVRIMAFIHKLPRVMLCSEPKHRLFVSFWEATDASPCLPFTTVSNVWPTLERSLKTPTLETERAIQKATQSYLEGFAQWSSLLNQ